jgi:hypothetical protein
MPSKLIKIKNFVAGKMKRGKSDTNPEPAEENKKTFSLSSSISSLLKLRRAKSSAKQTQVNDTGANKNKEKVISQMPEMKLVLTKKIRKKLHSSGIDDDKQKILFACGFFGIRLDGDNATPNLIHSALQKALLRQKLLTHPDKLNLFYEDSAGNQILCSEETAKTYRERMQPVFQLLIDEFSSMTTENDTRIEELISNWSAESNSSDLKNIVKEGEICRAELDKYIKTFKDEVIIQEELSATKMELKRTNVELNETNLEIEKLKKETAEREAKIEAIEKIVLSLQEKQPVTTTPGPKQKIGINFFGPVPAASSSEKQSRSPGPFLQPTSQT